jgi:DNA-binding response OmpR family regulator
MTHDGGCGASRAGVAWLGLYPATKAARLSPTEALRTYRSRPALPPTLVHGDLRLDSSRRLVTRGGQPLALSPKEFAVLELLLGAEGAVVSTEKILERAWDDATDPFTNAVRMTVSRLRAKLGDPPVIQTVTPVGYRIGAPP